MRVVALDTAHLGAWAALFEASHCPCYCRYWHFDRAKNEWLARCAHAPDLNRDEQSALVRAGDASARGLIAMQGEYALGWIKLAPRAALPKLTHLPAYRSLHLGATEGTWVIGCFLVHPDHRRSGVAHALLSAADEHVLAWGGCRIEAFPRRTSDALHDEEAWMGPESLFARLGFIPVHDVAPYPVLRKNLVRRES
jgi:GNAT superfamily N-acetyltransferase